jgi:hypothetical protein
MLKAAAAALFWPVTLLVAGLIFVVATLHHYNDRKYLTWVRDERFGWVEYHTDTRNGTQHDTRCHYCKGPLQAAKAWNTYIPCDKEECRTIISMDGELAKEAEKVLKAVSINVTQKPFTTNIPSSPNITHTPWINTGHNSNDWGTNVTWGGKHQGKTTSGNHNHASPEDKLMSTIKQEIEKLQATGEYEEH